MSSIEHNIVKKLIANNGNLTQPSMVTPDCVKWIFKSPEAYIEEELKEEGVWELQLVKCSTRIYRGRALVGTVSTTDTICFTWIGNAHISNLRLQS